MRLIRNIPAEDILQNSDSKLRIFKIENTFFIFYYLFYLLFLISGSFSASVYQVLYYTCHGFKSCRICFLSTQMLSMTLSLLVPLQPTSRASSVVVCSVSLADTKQRKRGKKKDLAGTPYRGSMGDLIQDTCWAGNRLVLTKEFNLGIIDSDKQICPRPVDWILQSPIQLLNSQAMLHLDWNSTAADSPIWLEATGMMEKVCWVRSSSVPVLFPGKHFFSLLKLYLNLPLKSRTLCCNYQLPAGAHS